MVNSYSNAEILSAVLTEWSKPVINQIAVGNIMKVGAMQSIQQTIVNSGLVGNNYSLAIDLKPFVGNIISSLIEPMLARQLSGIPDDAIPGLAHSIVNTAMQQPKFSILDGLVEFEQTDMEELKELLDKNLPLVPTKEKYSIIH